MDNPLIPPLDQERIDLMVASYRHSLESLYRLAHIQGEMDCANEVSAQIKRKETA